jgi:DNA-binding transcriptional MerR regulator
MASVAIAPRAYPEIPDKLYFRIGEVSRLAGVKQYVLRYWETEFPGIGPRKSGSNHRLYRRKDVELILEIKHLLYEKRYTIEGARKHLQEQSKLATVPIPAKPPKPINAPRPAVTLQTLRQEVQSLLSLLSDEVR